MPKGRRNSVDALAARDGKGKGRRKNTLKADFVAALLEILREQHENDYGPVALLLQKRLADSRIEGMPAGVKRSTAVRSAPEGFGASAGAPARGFDSSSA